MGKMITRQDISRMIQTIPVTMYHGQLGLLLANNSADAIALYGWFISNEVPLIMLNATENMGVVRSYVFAYHPYWLVYPILKEHNGICQKQRCGGNIFENYETVCEWNGYIIACRIGATNKYSYRWIENLALLLPTSGSTGGHKLVMLTKTNLSTNARSIAESLRMTSSDCSAVIMPISYAYGLSVVNSTFMSGGSLLIPETDIFHVECWDYLEENKVTVISGVPYAYECPYGRMHIMSDNVYIEVQGEDDEGDIYITTLQNHVMPMIRYKLNDTGKIIRNYRCQCGIISDILELNQRISDDMIMQNDGTNLNPRVLIDKFCAINCETQGEILQYQIRQIQISTYIVRLVICDKEWENYIKQRIIEGFHKLLGEVNVVFELYDQYIPENSRIKPTVFKNEMDNII